jgi:hypothetical protein
MLRDTDNVARIVDDHAHDPTISLDTTRRITIGTGPGGMTRRPVTRHLTPNPASGGLLQVTGLVYRRHRLRVGQLLQHVSTHIVGNRTARPS